MSTKLCACFCGNWKAPWQLHSCGPSHSCWDFFLPGEGWRGDLQAVNKQVKMCSWEPGMVAHTCNSSTWKAEAGGLGVLGNPLGASWPSDFKSNRDYTARHYLKKTKQNKHCSWLKDNVKEIFGSFLWCPYMPLPHTHPKIEH
jgi:hypothetical protein